jgi:hypothetical protein
MFVAGGARQSLRVGLCSRSSCCCDVVYMYLHTNQVSGPMTTRTHCRKYSHLPNQTTITISLQTSAIMYSFLFYN